MHYNEAINIILAPATPADQTHTAGPTTPLSAQMSDLTTIDTDTVVRSSSIHYFILHVCIHTYPGIGPRFVGPRQHEW